MLVIRQEQLNAFEDASLQDCLRFVLSLVREELSERDLAYGSSTLEGRVLDGIHRALRYELDSYADIAAFVTFLLTVGPEFDRYPFFQSVLTDEDLEPAERMTVLVELATDLDWSNAFDQGGEGSWLRDA